MLGGRFTFFIKRTLPASLRYFLYKIGFFLARDLNEVGKLHPSMEWSMRNLKRVGYRPHTIVDAGAYMGQWTKLIKTIYPDARVLMIEAQNGKMRQLEKVKEQFAGTVDYNISLIGPQDDGEVVFSEMQTGSSVFEERSSIPRVRIKKRTRTLDSIIAESHIPSPELMKLDLQGYELEALKGASETLRTTEVVVMEVALLEINEGAPLIDEVLQFMQSKDFVPYDICSLMRRPLDSALWQVDMIFVKNSSILLANQRYD